MYTELAQVINILYQSLKINFALANSAGPGEMLLHAYSLFDKVKYPFMGFQYTKD